MNLSKRTAIAARAFLLCTLFLLSPSFALAATNTQELPLRLSCVLHLHSTFSGGDRSLDRVVEEARKNHFDVVIPSDHDLMRWEYGLPPLRNLVKKTYEQESVLSFGPHRYLDMLNRAEALYGDILVIPAVESSPFYYWTGSPFDGTLTLNDWHKHLLVVGMEKPEDYRHLPLVSNPHAGVLSCALMWPALLIITGALVQKRTLLAVILILAGSGLLAYNYPFLAPRFSQYAGPRGELPYQTLIDYANARGALTFWAHPEAPNWETPKRIDPVDVVTPNYPASLLATQDYTGFAIFAQGYKEVGAPGKKWDKALLDYCRGERTKPVWAIGEIDYGESSAAINEVYNILWVKEKTKHAVMESLKAGNFAAVQRGKNWGLTLNEFSISSGKQKAVCGQELSYEKPVRIALGLSAAGAGAANNRHPVTMHLIRNGKVIKMIEAPLPVSLIYEDTSPLPPGKNYYRVVVEERTPHAIAFNPVFVVR